MSEVAAGSTGGSDVPDADDASAFHPGERSIQKRVGMREKIEAWGQRGLRDFMPEQHREFFRQLEYFFVATADARQRPWASLLTGQPGFLCAPDAHTLRVNAQPVPGDPLAANLRDGAQIGGLGIQLHTRRRNRINGTVTLHERGFVVRVRQSFGNCAQYIQARLPRRRPAARGEALPRQFEAFDGRMRAMLAGADTFFIASSYAADPADRRHGMDVSHRGGLPGFVHVEDERTLLWPDYRGNFFFNTLGNIALDPRCGLLFVDFDSGDLLQLTGRGEIVWDLARLLPEHRGAQRLVRFRIEEGLHIPSAAAFSWDFLGFAPQFVERGGSRADPSETD